jgi:hypothetical protein
MSGTPEAAAEELLPKYAELVRLLKMEKPERFAELARAFNADDVFEDARKNHHFRHQYAGKILCAARTKWESLQQQRRTYHQTLSGKASNNRGALIIRPFQIILKSRMGAVPRTGDNLAPTRIAQWC